MEPGFPGRSHTAAGTACGRGGRRRNRDRDHLPFFVLVTFTTGSTTTIFRRRRPSRCDSSWRIATPTRSMASCAGFSDDKSRRVFDALTHGQAAGQVWFRDVYEPHPYYGNDVVPVLPDGEVLVDAGAYLEGILPRSCVSTPIFERSTPSNRTGPISRRGDAVWRRFAGEALCPGTVRREYAVVLRG